MRLSGVWSGGSTCFFFEKKKKKKRGGSRWHALLSSHPHPLLVPLTLSTTAASTAPVSSVSFLQTEATAPQAESSSSGAAFSASSERGGARFAFGPAAWAAVAAQGEAEASPPREARFFRVLAMRE